MNAEQVGGARVLQRDDPPGATQIADCGREGSVEPHIIHIECAFRLAFGAVLRAGPLHHAFGGALCGPSCNARERDGIDATCQRAAGSGETIGHRQVSAVVPGAPGQLFLESFSIDAQPAQPLPLISAMVRALRSGTVTGYVLQVRGGGDDYLEPG